MSIDIKSRVTGCLLGLAVGDALGAPFEFKAPGTFETPTDMQAGGAHGLKAGQWTDDTSQALALADSLLKVDGFSGRDYLNRLTAWRREGRYSCTGTCFDIGLGTADALDEYERTERTVALKTGRNKGLGNGALMRVAPVALWAHDDEEAEFVARRQALTTHPNRRNADTCAWFVSDLLRSTFKGHGVPYGAARTLDSSGNFWGTADIAFHENLEGGTFEERVQRAIARGYDTDTTAAVTGALAGADLGVEAIPSRWLNKLAWRDEIEATAIKLAERGGWL